TVTVGSVMNWTGGSMTGTGRTVIPSGSKLAIANPGSVSLTSRTLENGGTTVWTGAGLLGMNGAVITNRAGALFEVQNAVDFSFFGGVSRFDNAGIFRKSGGGTTSFGTDVSFNNYNIA